jgi:hypothetical protein
LQALREIVGDAIEQKRRRAQCHRAPLAAANQRAIENHRAFAHQAIVSQSCANGISDCFATAFFAVTPARCTARVKRRHRQ